MEARRDRDRLGVEGAAVLVDCNLNMFSNFPEGCDRGHTSLRAFLRTLEGPVPVRGPETRQNGFRVPLPA